MSPANASDGANPLTRAEREVCQTLRHCLAIVESHPHDAFDYAVLAEEFARFGAKARKALIRMLDGDDPEAGHAADLIAVSGDAAFLPLLDVVSENRLIRRTHEALSLRLGELQPATDREPAIPTVSDTLGPCPSGTPVSVHTQAGEMPFFEAAIARPDHYGAYRPSAKYHLPLRQSARKDLRSATAVPGGWIAGYAGGLVHYDNANGKPTRLSEEAVLGVLRLHPGRLDKTVWAFMAEGNDLRVVIVSDKASTSVANLPGPLSSLQRGVDGSLLIGVAERRVLRLLPDGTIVEGCPS